ncbi:MAG TPA: tRNA preQ1(34) S-adenosylmethionine ribosyltransferase-isomerase QueA, partial [Tepidisphaeraceae bacterium]
MRTDELDFDLPPELIAQTPPETRSASRLLHYIRANKTIHHQTFSDLPALLRPSDVLVFNDSKVIPARFTLKKETGGQIEGLFLSEPAIGQWLVMLRDIGQPSPGTILHFDSDPSLRVKILTGHGHGEFLVQISEPLTAIEILNRLGRMPLPPYIKRQKQSDERDTLDRERYQTVYADSPGAVAAPTAGLHFTSELLSQLDIAGITRVMITLHVGAGTFKPISAENLADHPMHTERFSIDLDAAEALNLTKAKGRRIIAVGTTSARVLESHPADLPFSTMEGKTNIFIYPPY